METQKLETQKLETQKLETQKLIEFILKLNDKESQYLYAFAKKVFYYR